MFSLEAKIRTELAKECRENGSIPAVLYGKDTPSTKVAVGVSEFIKVYRQAGKNHVISLTVDKKSYNVLVHEAQRHPVSGAFLHLDFLTVDMKAEVQVDIPVVITGTSPAVLEWGKIHQTLDAVTVRCLPKDIVDGFELDISELTMGHTFHVSDMKIDTKKYHIVSPLEDAVITAHAPKGGVKEDSAE